MKDSLLEIKNLNVSIDDKEILKGFNLTIKKNEIHILMGPNGSGKSTLSKVLAGHPAYKIKKGEILFHQKNLLNMSLDQRSHEGLFLAFQYPIEIAGVTNYDFLRIAFNEKQKYKGEKEMDPLEFMEIIQVYLQKLKIEPEFLYRNLNEGFSGGEKKKNEILQMLLLHPNLIILDEIDSGLDVDAIKLICEEIVKNRFPDSSFLIITHYPKILQYFQPTHIHILMNGKIQKTGNGELVEQLEKEGYQSFSLQS